MHYLIGVDVGTSGCKVMVFDEDYRPHASTAREYVVTSPRPGWAEFDPQDIWVALCGAVREALGGLGAGGGDRSFSMSCSVFGEGLIACDETGRLVYPGMLSSDLRSTAIAERFATDLGRERLFERTGRTPHTMAVVTKMLWLKENLSNRIGPQTRFLDVHGWLYGRLGVGTVTDYSCISGTMCFDINDRTWHSDVLDWAGLAVRSLPEAVQAGTPVGDLNHDVAGALGFTDSDRVQVVVGAMDQLCNAVGSGTVLPGDLVCSTGTVEAITVVLDPGSHFDALLDFNMARVPSAIRGQFVTHALLWDGGRSLGWFCSNFARKEKEDAERQGASVYDELLSRTPRARSMFFLPHLSGSGTPWQNPASRGALLGLTTSSDVVSAAHAIIEGVTFELKLNLDNVESLGTKVNTLRVVGGGSRSDRWLQLKADVLKRDVFRLAVGEAGCMGAAILAGYGSGLFDDPVTASKRIVRTTDVFHPSAESEYYERKHAIFAKIYPNLAAINREISDLDGQSLT